MRIKLNGEERELQNGLTLLGLIESEGVADKVMAAAVNMQIVKKEEWGSKVLCDADSVELLQFVGGG